MSQTKEGRLLNQYDFSMKEAEQKIELDIRQKLRCYS